MSRYSRIFLRPKDNTASSSSSWIAESSAKFSTAQTRTSSSPGCSYPPSSLPSHDTKLPMPSHPHPYTLAAFHSHVESASREGSISHIQQTTSASEFSRSEKPPDSIVGHTYPQIHPIEVPSRHGEQPLPIRLPSLVVFLIFLPIPPLLSLIYMLTGHVILRQAQSSPNSIYHAPLLSSVNAGATGGIILSVPLALLLYLLLFTIKPPTAPEDFFEDDDSTMLGRARWVRYLGYAVCALLVLCIGGVAGPLGVTCLSIGTTNVFVESKKMLSISAAAAAGFMGGLVLAFGTVTLCVVGFISWIRLKKPSS